MTNPAYTFEISLTVLNHLGRQLYRNFITILGEAISNSWDADSNNVWIEMDTETGTLLIADDGGGMDENGLQHRFLKIGYTKRIEARSSVSPRQRPYIGAKGIGKLALLSCAEKVSVVSKTATTVATGCLIDNATLDDAIEDDQTPHEFNLPNASNQAYNRLKGLGHGTVLYFEGLRARNSTEEFLRKALSISYRFSLVDPSFNIHFNGEQITVSQLSGLAQQTQYVWTTSDFQDPYLQLAGKAKHYEITGLGEEASGFIASVFKPSQLAIYGAKERVGIDLFVNGRLRERNLQLRFPSARVPVQYLYGQIHFNALETGDTDPFTSSREGVVEGNEAFEGFLDKLEGVVQKIVNDWDKFRLREKDEGDPENPRRTRRKRAAETLAHETANELKYEGISQTAVRLIEEASTGMVDASEDYARLYLVENSLREALTRQHVVLKGKDKNNANKYRRNADKLSKEANLAIIVRQHSEDLWFLDLGPLMQLLDKDIATNIGFDLAAELPRLRLLRNVVMHTAGLTEEGRSELEAIVNNLMMKVKLLLTSLDQQSAGDES